MAQEMCGYEQVMSSESAASSNHQALRDENDAETIADDNSSVMPDAYCDGIEYVVTDSGMPTENMLSKMLKLPSDSSNGSELNSVCELPGDFQYVDEWFKLKNDNINTLDFDTTRSSEIDIGDILSIKEGVQFHIENSDGATLPISKEINSFLSGQYSQDSISNHAMMDQGAHSVLTSRKYEQLLQADKGLFEEMLLSDSEKSKLQGLSNINENNVDKSLLDEVTMPGINENSVHRYGLDQRESIFAISLNNFNTNPQSTLVDKISQSDFHVQDIDDINSNREDSNCKNAASESPDRQLAGNQRETSCNYEETNSIQLSNSDNNEDLQFANELAISGSTIDEKLPNILHFENSSDMIDNEENSCGDILDTLDKNILKSHLGITSDLGSFKVDTSNKFENKVVKQNTTNLSKSNEAALKNQCSTSSLKAKLSPGSPTAKSNHRLLLNMNKPPTITYQGNNCNIIASNSESPSKNSVIIKGIEKINSNRDGNNTLSPIKVQNAVLKIVTQKRNTNPKTYDCVEESGPSNAVNNSVTKANVPLVQPTLVLGINKPVNKFLSLPNNLLEALQNTYQLPLRSNHTQVLNQTAKNISQTSNRVSIGNSQELHNEERAIKNNIETTKLQENVHHGQAKVVINVNAVNNATTVTVTSSNNEQTVFKVNTSDLMLAVSSITDANLEHLGLLQSQLVARASTAMTFINDVQNASCQNFEINQMLPELKSPMSRKKQLENEPKTDILQNALAAANAPFKASAQTQSVVPSSQNNAKNQIVTKKIVLSKPSKAQVMATRKISQIKNSEESAKLPFFRNSSSITTTNAEMPLICKTPSSLTTTTSVAPSFSGKNMPSISKGSDEMETSQSDQKKNVPQEKKGKFDDVLNEALEGVGITISSILDAQSSSNNKQEWHCNQPACNTVCSKLSLLKVHILGHFNVRPYSCTYDGCDWSFSSSVKLKRHLQTHLNRRDFVCEEPNCNKRFSTIYNLRSHQQIHQVPHEWHCDTDGCTQSFRTERLYQMHLRHHSNVQAPYKCTVKGCTRAYFSSSSLTFHIRNHSKDQSELKCSWPGCGRQYDKPCRLKAHMRVHTGQRPFVCDYEGCKWSFKSSSKLTRHKKKHTNSRNFECSICKKSFLRSEHLKGHLILHSGERNFHCHIEGCDAKFSAKSSLYVHLKKHNKSNSKKSSPPTETLHFPCPAQNCRKVFSSMSSLKEHVLVEHGAVMDSLDNVCASSCNTANSNVPSTPHVANCASSSHQNTMNVRPSITYQALSTQQTEQCFTVSTPEGTTEHHHNNSSAIQQFCEPSRTLPSLASSTADSTPSLLSGIELLQTPFVSGPEDALGTDSLSDSSSHSLGSSFLQSGSLGSGVELYLPDPLMTAGPHLLTDTSAPLHSHQTTINLRDLD